MQLLLGMLTSNAESVSCVLIVRRYISLVLAMPSKLLVEEHGSAIGGIAAVPTVLKFSGDGATARLNAVHLAAQHGHVMIINAVLVQLENYVFQVRVLLYWTWS